MQYYLLAGDTAIPKRSARIFYDQLAGKGIVWCGWRRLHKTPPRFDRLLLPSGQLRYLQSRRGWHYPISSKFVAVHQWILPALAAGFFSLTPNEYGYRSLRSWVKAGVCRVLRASLCTSRAYMSTTAGKLGLQFLPLSPQRMLRAC